MKSAFKQLCVHTDTSIPAYPLHVFFFEPPSVYSSLYPSFHSSLLTLYILPSTFSSWCSPSSYHINWWICSLLTLNVCPVLSRGTVLYVNVNVTSLTVYIMCVIDHICLCKVQDWFVTGWEKCQSTAQYVVFILCGWASHLCVCVHVSMCVLLESCAGHASWSEESWYAVLRCLHMPVSHLPLLSCFHTMNGKQKWKKKENEWMKNERMHRRPPYTFVLEKVIRQKTEKTYISYFCLVMLLCYKYMEELNKKWNDEKTKQHVSVTIATNICNKCILCKFKT